MFMSIIIFLVLDCMVFLIMWLGMGVNWITVLLVAHVVTWGLMLISSHLYHFSRKTLIRIKEGNVHTEKVRLQSHDL